MNFKEIYIYIHTYYHNKAKHTFAQLQYLHQQMMTLIMLNRSQNQIP